MPLYKSRTGAAERERRGLSRERGSSAKTGLGLKRATWERRVVWGESETTDSVPSDEESSEGRPHWRKRNIEGKQYLSNMGTRTAYLLPSMATFVTSNKPDLQVTVKEESCPVPYNSSWPPFPDLPLTAPGTPAPSSSRPDRETRASVIKKTSDVTQARVKSC